MTLSAQLPYERVLVVADWRADAHAVTAAVQARSAENVAVFSVVVPAWLHGVDWIGDPTASRPCAHAQVEKLEDLWAESNASLVSAQVGDPDPVAAAEDALADWPANEIMLVTAPGHSLSIARRIARATGLPTRGVATTSSQGRRQPFGWARRGGRHCAVEVREAA